jgi:mRNA-degrading endonuclease RelE of RelBE toxin-antitoxin system
MAIKAGPNPLVFGDLNPSIQLEIIHTLAEHLGGDMDAACAKLKATQDDMYRLAHYTEIYNCSLQAEDITTLEHRKRQRAALKKLDRGVHKDLIKEELSKNLRTTCSELSQMRKELGAENTMQAKASDVRLSYAFLDRLDLPRILAGTWYSGKGTRFHGHYKYPTPKIKEWNWAEDLSKRRANQARPAMKMPVREREEPRHRPEAGASRTKSPIKQVATLTDYDRSIARDFDEDVPFWYTHGPPTSVTDSEARYQWNLTKIELEAIRHEKALYEAELEVAKKPVENPYYCLCDDSEHAWYSCHE